MGIKKTTIITLAIVGLAVIIVATLTYYRTTEEELSTVPMDTPESSANIPSFPEQTNNQLVSIENPNDLDEIKKAFSDFVSEPAKANIAYTGVRVIRFADNKGKLLSLSTISSSLGITIPKTLADLVEDEDYDIFYCSSGDGEKDYGLILYARSAVGRSLNEGDYKNIVGQMKQWESSMLRDLHLILFPNISFSEPELGQKLLFRDGNVRFTEIQMPDGTKGSINYKQFGDSIMITSSLECLSNGSGYFFDIEE